MWPVVINALMSVAAYFATLKTIPRLKDMFIRANLCGIDMSKTKKERIPEAQGVVTGCIFLITLFLFIPVPFNQHITEKNYVNLTDNEFVEMLAALLSICCMLLLGFVDDVLDLRWRHKLLVATIASLPLLMVYYVNFNSTSVVVPKPFRQWCGLTVDLGWLFYVYMGMLAVFCTNAINILAGVNGLEVGQSVVIACSVAAFNLVELFGGLWRTHQFSLFFMLPYLATSVALLRFNWYPSQVFVGDTFCYFSGMTFAVVGILGHFSKMLLLFFIPQVANFLYSVPQLFHFIPCPRHRLPRYNASTDRLEVSTTRFRLSQQGVLGRASVGLLRALRLAHVEEGAGEDGDQVECSNLTLLNLVLLWRGPMHEESLVRHLLALQRNSSRPEPTSTTSQ
ncbi:UDP-N-acetylglucosamine--dolichyl-phosphate N-acetylglucosaminephosphotransferase isoform X2 [Bacillus rossius redtenbacheri]|uniref:UDP-N-acetylglucosamine--dolichyl-phosphate N-acetylglucosaminephosphotransferase isoform X2 n=1 Tax=Bacillus rossius redtenbacheri TaxID=93214 RepID=UPI002FDED586